MNIFLWVLQVLLALHTVMGAVWKLSHSRKGAPSLKAIPDIAWKWLSVVEFLFAAGLVLPALNRQLAILAPAAAVCLAAEMLFFTGVHLYSGFEKHGQMIYWLVVAAICTFIAYGRFVLSPL
jgi:hypothetical protein